MKKLIEQHVPEPKTNMYSNNSIADAPRLMKRAISNEKGQAAIKGQKQETNLLVLIPAVLLYTSVTDGRQKHKSLYLRSYPQRLLLIVHIAS